MSDVTRLLQQIDDGSQLASEELLPLVYDELKRLAAAKMSAERADHTLQPTALVHEAYLRLVTSEDDAGWSGRGHFFGAAAEAMRRILVDHARSRRRLKRGSDARRVELDTVDWAWNPQNGDLLSLHEALERFEQDSPQAAELVKLCCFAGQTQAEAAALLGVSPRTAKRRWAYARAWLYEQLNDADAGRV